MEKTEKKSIELRLLKHLNEVFSENGFASEMDKAQLGTTAFDLCRVFYVEEDDAENDECAEFFFLNTPLSSDDALYFIGLVTLFREIDEKRIPDLISFVTRLNPKMPFGSFVVDQNARMLMLRMDALYAVSEDENSIYHHMDLMAAHLLELTDKFSDAPVKLCTGEFSLQEALDYYHLM